MLRTVVSAAILATAMLVVTPTTAPEAIKGLPSNISQATQQALSSLVLLYQNLTQPQRHTVDNIVEQSGNETDATLSGKIDTFVGGLSDQLQNTYNSAKTQVQNAGASASAQVNQIVQTVNGFFSNATTNADAEYHRLIDQIMGTPANQTLPAPNPAVN